MPPTRLGCSPRQPGHPPGSPNSFTAASPENRSNTCWAGRNSAGCASPYRPGSSCRADAPRCSWSWQPGWLGRARWSSSCAAGRRRSRRCWRRESRDYGRMRSTSTRPPSDVPARTSRHSVATCTRVTSTRPSPVRSRQCRPGRRQRALRPDFSHRLDASGGSRSRAGLGTRRRRGRARRPAPGSRGRTAMACSRRTPAHRDELAAGAADRTSSGAPDWSRVERSEELDATVAVGESQR